MTLRSSLKSEALKLRHKATSRAFGRERSKNSKGLTFINTVSLILKGIKESYKSELDTFFNSNLNNHPDDLPSASAFCQARAKIKHGVFIDLNSTLLNRYYKEGDLKDWLDMRVLAIDGSTVHIPDTVENVEYFKGWKGKHGKGKTCPKGRVSLCYDVMNKVIVDAKLAPTSVGEEELGYQHLQSAGMNDLVLYDRGYASYKLFRIHDNMEISFCCRLPEKQYSRLCEEFLESSEDDITVMYSPLAPTANRCKAEDLSTDEVKLRLIKVELDSGEIEVLATNVFDQRLSASSFKKLYHKRWGVEEEYKRLKSRFQVEAFSGLKQEFVYQDFYAAILGLNISSICASKARTKLENESKRGNKYYYAPNMSYALGKLRTIIMVLLNNDTYFVKSKIAIITEMISRNKLPIRPNRSYPRERKPKRSENSMPYKRVI